jgi:urease accessory protein
VLRAFAEGLLNPLLTPAHTLALVALGLFIGWHADRVGARLIFPMALAGGLFALTFAVGQMPARIVLLADTAVIGVLVATAWGPPRPVGWLLVAIAGAAIGLDSPPQAITIAEANATLVGTAFGACAVMFAVITAASYASLRWHKLAMRILGSWIAASAILVLAVLLR